MENNMNTQKFGLRLKRVNDAIALTEPDFVPVVPNIDGIAYTLYPGIGATHKNAMYGHDKAIAAVVRYHEEFEPDANTLFGVFMDGEACDILKPDNFDWPGRAGSKVADASVYQVMDREYMSADEYDEFLSDYTGFMVRKFLPRAYGSLKGLEGFDLDPNSLFGTRPLAPLTAPPVQEALKTLVRLGEAAAKNGDVLMSVNMALAQAGFPPFFTGVASCPFDILSDYIRGTMGTLMDQVERRDKVAAACELLSGVVTGTLQYFRFAELPVRRVFFPLHKGMDGFMSDEDYRDLYWAPFQKVLEFLIGIGVTPLIFTEGPYNTRIKFLSEKLSELPPGSCIIHFDKGNFKEIKKAFSGKACIMGGIQGDLLRAGTKEEVADNVKYLIDNCAAGGGYMIDVDTPLEIAKRENLETMFETARAYGKR